MAGDLVAGDLVVGVAGALVPGDLVSVPRRVATISVIDLPKNALQIYLAFRIGI